MQSELYRTGENHIFMKYVSERLQNIWHCFTHTFHGASAYLNLSSAWNYLFS